MKYRLAEFIWRRKNANDLQGGLVNALKKVAFSNIPGDDIEEEFVYTEVKRTRSDLDHDDEEEFNGDTQEEPESETESEDNDSGDEYQPSTNNRRKKPRSQ